MLDDFELLCCEFHEQKEHLHSQRAGIFREAPQHVEKVFFPTLVKLLGRMWRIL